MDKRAPVFRPAGHFVLRTPLLPLETLANWPSNLGEAKKALGALLERQEVVAAIALASPAVAAGIPLWRESPGSLQGKS